MSLMMADCVGFQAQIASIIELLANSAVVEICKLVEDGMAALRSQMEQEREKSAEENDALRHRLREMDVKMRSYERKMRRGGGRSSSGAGSSSGSSLGQQQQREEATFNRPPEASCGNFPGTEDHQPRVAPLPVVSEDIQTFQHMAKEDAQAVPLVKQEKVERSDCNLDLKVEVNIRAECGLSSDLEPNEEANSNESPLSASVAVPAITQTSSPRADATMDLTCRPPRAKRKLAKPVGGPVPTSGGMSAAGRSLADVALKLDGEPNEEDAGENDHQTSQLSGTGSSSSDAAPSPERGGLSSLGLDLAWMQERVSHLGAAFAVAQLGLGNVEAAGAHPSAAFPSTGGGGADGLDAAGQPTMLFPGGAHEMAAFAASFDMAAAAAAAPPPGPPNAASAASTGSQRRPYRNGGGAAAAGGKDPAACGVCGRVFPSPAALELHSRVHTGERPYSCPHCGKGFAQPNNLRVHLLIHSGERRYHCSLCGKSFISSSHLKRHRTVHTQEKPYTCARCGQSFSQMCSVRRHRQQSQCGSPPSASEPSPERGGLNSLGLDLAWKQERI